MTEKRRERGPKLTCLQHEKATHIGALLVKDKKERCGIAMDLRRAMNRMCNRK